MWLPFSPPVGSLAGDSAFLLLAWCELFGDYTPDTCQPRLYHTASLVSELREIAVRATSATRWERHLDGLRAELRASVTAEEEFLRRLPGYDWALQRLLAEKNANNSAVLAKTIEARTPEYENAACQELREAVAKLPRTKEATLAALRRFATVIIRTGRTSAECLALVTPNRLNQPPSTIAEDLIAFTRPRRTSYRCFFAVRGERHSAQQILRKVGFTLISKKDFVAGAGRELGDDMVGIEITLEADLPLDAARKAMVDLRRAMDVFNFYCNRPELELDSKCVVADALGNRTPLPLGNMALQRLHRRKKPAVLTHTILSTIPAGRLSNRLLNALEHSSLAQTSAIPRVQLVNLWSAVECLSGASHAQSILAQVIEVLAPIVTFQRTEKTLRYLAINLAKLHEDHPTGTLGEGFPKSQKLVKFVLPEELFLVLCRPEKHPHIVQLLAFCAPHPLLLNRVYSLWQLYHLPKKLGQKLASARQTIEWHLARIYRARNLIVHEGVEVPHIPWLLDHLHYYFSAACGRVLDALQVHPDWGVEEAMMWWRTKCQYQLDGLTQFPEKLLVADIFRGPKANLAALHPWLDYNSIAPELSTLPYSDNAPTPAQGSDSP